MRILSSLAVLTAALALCACGGDDNAFQGTGTGTGGTSTTQSLANDPVKTLTVTSSTPSILADGSTTATITALVLDANNNLLGNVPVSFSATSGGVAGSPATTDPSGAATVTLSTAGDATLRTITVTATAAGISQGIGVQVVPGTSSASVQMGYTPPAGAFEPGVLGLGAASLSAGGSTSVNVSLELTGGSLYTTSTPITFSSPCQANGLATITTPVTTTTGIASSTYAAKGCSGADLITATATVGSTTLTATGTVTVVAATVGSIVFVSATPTNVGLKGTGAAGSQETSTVIFQVLDSSGGPVANANVDFSLDTSVGGITLAPPSGMTDANGNVQTVVQAGTVATSVRVTATVQGVTPVIATQSSELTITTGIPTQNEFSIAVTPCPNIEAWNIDGQDVTVTVRMADRFSNPVPDGTAVTFSTQGGKIGGQCTTATTASESGVCSVTWTSQDPRPAGYCAPHCTPSSYDAGGASPFLQLGQSVTVGPTTYYGPPTHAAGRSSILATAIGEESFIDANGNGEYDSGETFFDRAERFRDDFDLTDDQFDTDSNYQVGDFYYDFNNNQVRDPADGIFEGVLCTAGAPVCDPTKTTTGIGKRTLIIFSTSNAVISGPASVTIAHGTGGALVYQIEDENGNPIPWDATITATAAGSAGSIAAPSTLTEGCSIARGGNLYQFNLTAPSSPGGGTVTINVTTKSGAVTTFVTDVTVS